MPARDRRTPFWSKWVWKDWYASTAAMSPEARGAHIDLMAYAATNSPDRCSVPDDDRIMAYAARIRLERWRRIREQVLSHWSKQEPSGQSPQARWVQTRLAVDASEYDKSHENQHGRVNETGNNHDRSGSYARVARELEVRSKRSEEESDSTLAPISVNGTVKTVRTRTGKPVNPPADETWQGWKP